ncbi:sulfotransferase [Pseudalkalibacillus sp. Hm43]|uniref:sulfotransferase n=1 Tax=Pseudalkalibacillus sp. Hm43 TaxID=3450742 RepID=UPI003F41DFD4
MDKNILVTGSHRSGSTFVGKMLSINHDIGYVSEPFNYNFGIKGVENWFPYVDHLTINQDKYKRMVNDLLNGKAKYKKNKSNSSNIKSNIRKLIGSKSSLQYKAHFINPKVKRLLIKDPIACFMSEWLHREFDMDVIILVRHPAAFISSLKRLNWRFDFNHFTKQEILYEKYLNVFLEYRDLDNLTILEEGCLLWNSLYGVLLQYLENNPSMICMTHEQISENPIDSFTYLYQLADLDFNKKVERTIKDYTGFSNPSDPTSNKVHVLKRNSAKNTKRWKQNLSAEEISYIKDRTNTLSKNFYKEDDW